jgi:hypothetical protein
MSKKSSTQDFSNRKLKLLDLSLVQEIKEGIVKLKLSNNNLVFIPWSDLVLACPQLLSVHLTKNALTTLSPDIGLFGYLEEIKLDHNFLESIPSEISMLVRLRKMDLSHNKLRSLPTEVSRLSSLETLDISRNCMKYLPLSLCFLTQLKALDYSDNPLFIRPPQSKDVSSVLSFLQTIFDSVNSNSSMFQVQLGRGRQSEGPEVRCLLVSQMWSAAALTRILRSSRTYGTGITTCTLSCRGPFSRIKVLARIRRTDSLSSPTCNLKIKTLSMFIHSFNSVMSTTPRLRGKRSGLC